jgi:sarcosine oxidase subunit alpha
MSELSLQGVNNSSFSAGIEAQPFRLAKGGLIDRRVSLEFRFDRSTLSGFPGDTLASALLANGRHLVAALNITARAE